jgi:hypothetical protein
MSPYSLAARQRDTMLMKVGGLGGPCYTSKSCCCRGDAEQTASQVKGERDLLPRADPGP